MQSLEGAGILRAGDPAADRGAGQGAPARRVVGAARGSPTSSNCSTRLRARSAARGRSADMHIESFGSGPDLVLIHGWAMHGGIFAPLTPLLAERFRVHVVDLPGHGYASAVRTRASIRPLCGATSPRACRRRIWVGWSFGGLVSLRAALEQPDRVRGIVEIAASPKFVASAGLAAWRRRGYLHPVRRRTARGLPRRRSNASSPWKRSARRTGTTNCAS